MPYKKRPKVIAGNWKMHKTRNEAFFFVQTLTSLVKKSQESVFLAVPFTLLHPLSELKRKENFLFKFGAQNMHDEEKGAFTGEISVAMLKDAGAEFVILGHSERRHLFGESCGFINKKVKRALGEKILPILCVGETAKEKEEGATKKILESQLYESLEGISDLKNLMIAYEPVWAIGTGKVATPKDAQEAHSFCRKLISRKWGEAAADRLIFLYGGSVKPENAADLMDMEDVDGLLIGGASLAPESFSQIVNVTEDIK